MDSTQELDARLTVSLHKHIIHVYARFPTCIHSNIHVRVHTHTFTHRYTQKEYKLVSNRLLIIYFFTFLMI